MHEENALKVFVHICITSTNRTSCVIPMCTITFLFQKFYISFLVPQDLMNVLHGKMFPPCSLILYSFPNYKLFSLFCSWLSVDLFERSICMSGIGWQGTKSEQNPGMWLGPDKQFIFVSCHSMMKYQPLDITTCKIHPK